MPCLEHVGKRHDRLRGPVPEPHARVANAEKVNDQQQSNKRADREKVPERPESMCRRHRWAKIRGRRRRRRRPDDRLAHKVVLADCVELNSVPHRVQSRFLHRSVRDELDNACTAEPVLCCHNAPQ
eukprot:Amastigsp_a842130_31.p4 type:complete len:126 gc:universal Amastigsp_a842130_31:1105-728(-)